MLLNALNQNFVISIHQNFIYPDVIDTWKPVLDRMWAPYNTCEDFINSQITQINFPGVNAQPASQNIRMYNVQKRPGQTFDQLLQKTMTLTIKTTESYVSYFLMRHQFQLFLKLREIQPLYMNPITVSILNDGGFETVSYVYKQLTMTGISDLNLSYAATLGNFNTFTASFVYNYYDVYVVNGDGKRERIATDFDPQLDFEQEILDSDSAKYKTKQHEPVSTKTQVRKAESEQVSADRSNKYLQSLRSVSKNTGNSGLINPTLR